MVILSKTKMKKLLISLMIFSMVAVPFTIQILNTENTSACNTQECREAAAAQNEAIANANANKSSMNLYEAKVQELTQRIAEQEAAIKSTEAEITELKKKIAEGEAKLALQQEALAEMLVNMHFEGDAEPITILAGASSISDLAEKQSRNEVAREQIGVMAAEVKAQKEQLEADKAEVEEKLAQQQEQKRGSEADRAEQQELVRKYKDNMDAYNEQAKAAKEAYNKAYNDWLATLNNTSTSNPYHGSVNTYPWQADCPQKQDWFATSWNGYIIGGLVCECVSYTGWKAYEVFGKVISWGNAYSWDDYARALGYRVDHTPAPNTIGQIDGYPYGHVFWVESVNADGSINITEYNNAYATQLYSGIYRYGDFGAQTISAGAAAKYNYIHF
ncbi:MAG: CHAP domain-containing protein [Candidatus Saccharibacteria bacterium]|nr:CHAP domain-containing protein [Candidatus Saccharibacteria bacterium]